MDDDEIQSSGSMLLVALAVLAIALGGAGLYFGFTANQRINPIAETMDAGTTGIAEVEKQISGLGTRLEELAIKADGLTQALKRANAYGTQREQAIKKLAGELNSNRELIVKTAKQLNEVASGGFRAAPAPAPAPTRTVPQATSVAVEGNAPAATGTTAASGTGKVYSIAGGDTFAKVAAKLDVSLQDLLDANPGVDPRRLAIGQEINIPSN